MSDDDGDDWIEDSAGWIEACMDEMNDKRKALVDLLQRARPAVAAGAFFYPQRYDELLADIDRALEEES